MKNALVGTKIKSFWAKYLGDRSHPFIVSPRKTMRSTSDSWMTFFLEMKNTPIGSKIRSFRAKYLGDRSRPFKVVGPLFSPRWP